MDPWSPGLESYTQPRPTAAGSGYGWFPSLVCSLFVRPLVRSLDGRLSARAYNCCFVESEKERESVCGGWSEIHPITIPTDIDSETTIEGTEASHRNTVAGLGFPHTLDGGRKSRGKNI